MEEERFRSFLNASEHVSDESQLSEAPILRRTVDPAAERSFPLQAQRSHNSIGPQREKLGLTWPNTDPSAEGRRTNRRQGQTERKAFY